MNFFYYLWYDWWCWWPLHSLVHHLAQKKKKISSNLRCKFSFYRKNSNTWLIENPHFILFLVYVNLDKNLEITGYALRLIYNKAFCFFNCYWKWKFCSSNPKSVRNIFLFPSRIIQEIKIVVFKIAIFLVHFAFLRFMDLW